MIKSNEVEEVEDPPIPSGPAPATTPATATATATTPATASAGWRLPAPQSFAEGQRYIYGLLAAAAGVFCGLAAVAMIALLMWGGWSIAQEHRIVPIFGWALGGFIAAMVAVIVGLLAGGPVGRFKVSASRDGASLEADCAPRAGSEQ